VHSVLQQQAYNVCSLPLTKSTSKQMAQVPPQSGASSFTALALTNAIVCVRTAGKRAAALEPAAGAASSTMGGSSLGLFSGMSASSMRSWKLAVNCLHALLCPRFQSTSWHALEQ